MKSKPSTTKRGFSHVDLLLIVAAVVGITIVILPALTRPRAPYCRAYCSNNLKAVGLAFLIWAGDNDDKFPMQVSVTNGGAMELANEGSAHAVFMVMSNELNTPKILTCPDETTPQRVAATVFALNAPAGSIPFTATNHLSYFVGLDADETKPDSILSGDDNFVVGPVTPSAGLWRLNTNSLVEWSKSRHTYGGNVGMADGSVQGFTTPAFRAALVKTGIATNRLAMP